jgi:uncharacterized protein YyaL (SSP411 family)
MTDAAGAFHATQDADSEGEEGKYFVWSPAELEGVLGAEEGRRAAKAYGVTAQGTFEHGKSVLERRVPLPDLAGSGGSRRARRAAGSSPSGGGSWPSGRSASRQAATTRYWPDGTG